MYGLVAVFKPIRPTPESGGWNEGLNFGNIAVEPRTRSDRDHGGGGGGMGRMIECWRCGGDHTKIDCPKCAEDKEKK